MHTALPHELVAALASIVVDNIVQRSMCAATVSQWLLRLAAGASSRFWNLASFFGFQHVAFCRTSESFSDGHSIALSYMSAACLSSYRYILVCTCIAVRRKVFLAFHSLV